MLNIQVGHLCYKKNMKKLFLIGCISLITACNIGIQPPATETIQTETPLSSPLPVTATEISFFTPTSAPTSESLPLYFTDEFTTESSYWQFLQTGGINFPTTTYASDTLRIDISSRDTWLIGVHNAHTYSNVFVRAKASLTPTGSVGLICSYDENTGWFEYNVASDGTYSVLLGQWLAEGIAKYIPIADGVNNQIVSSNLNYQIGLDCRDNFLSIYINDVIIRRIDVTNYGVTEGSIGITASSFLEAPLSFIFESVQVSEE